MSILKEIILNKRKEIDYLKNNNSISEIEKSLFFDREVISLKKSLIVKPRPKLNIIMAKQIGAIFVTISIK